MITAQEFIDHTRTYLGVPYKHTGRTRESGLDCIGLFSRVAQDLGIKINDTLNYSRDPDPAKMGASLYEHLDEVAPCEAGPGCILWLRFFQEPQHVALLSERGTIIHSYSRVGEVVEHKYSRSWARRVVRAFKIKGVKYEQW